MEVIAFDAYFLSRDCAPPSRLLEHEYARYKPPARHIQRASALPDVAGLIPCKLSFVLDFRKTGLSLAGMMSGDWCAMVESIRGSCVRYNLTRPVRIWGGHSKLTHRMLIY